MNVCWAPRGERAETEPHMHTPLPHSLTTNSPGPGSGTPPGGSHHKTRGRPPSVPLIFNPSCLRSPHTCPPPGSELPSCHRGPLTTLLCLLSPPFHDSPHSHHTPSLPCLTLPQGSLSHEDWKPVSSPRPMRPHAICSLPTLRSWLTTPQPPRPSVP